MGEIMREFYKFYLSEHQNVINRRLHFLGTLSASLLLIFFLRFHLYKYLIFPFIAGYGPAWIGHFFFEKNKPASFKYPIKSFLCDWWMAFDILRGKISIRK